ncbi:GNAT family N-acetyltransferase [Litorisediminicola beolgyonensis]|uniref:GNAT family N-acetyltransferase n=1 Tax=Litorisediminicola beolgyonensis TaxID=1173614 RepID=A0ABW3ZEU1_9RHOB
MSVTLRPARPLDAGALGAILDGWVRATPWMPQLYSGAEAVSFLSQMIDAGWVTTAETDGAPAGFLARDGGDVHALYLGEGARGRGIGARLLDAAKSGESALSLWTFEANTGAQRFYDREGFVPVRRTSGDNDEGLPDIQFRWQRSETT